MKTCKEAEDYILSIPKFAGKHSLADTKGLLLRLMGDDATGVKSKIIHIAGTNGKGSVCAYLRSMLLAGGCSVGTFISPHLETMRERISYGNDMILEEDFLRVFEKVLGAVSKEKFHPSFFEFLFLMAMVYFREKEPEYLILETGMGGRLDATNCVENPAVCVITEIGYDHMQYLGDTIPEIAGEKAGIIKRGVPVVFVDKRKESTEVLAEYAKKAESPTIIIGKESILNVNINHKSIDFSLHTGYYSYVSLSLNTTALYQMENASLAVAALHTLDEKRMTEDAVRTGLWKAAWPGRMEEIIPGVYLDGAHNEDGIEAFLNTVKYSSCEGRRLFMFGVLADKQFDAMVQKIADSELFDEVVGTVVETDRSVSAKELAATFKKHEKIRCSFYEDAKEAYRYLLTEKKDKDIIYVAGSLYLIGQIRSFTRRMKNA
ncbi:MAG: bifunctional folylpolyglutamate synthase/dihydrofolate synthase [Lachnospiraceae bacterium]|nr:bifunctional folylpolyglutamate synthase/dihydrofolate synthase [Lachnospiraceae bacterium]